MESEKTGSQENMEALRQFARFLKENHLQELGKEYLSVIRSLDIPLMKYFEHLPEDQLMQLTIKGLDDFLTSIIENRLYEKMREDMKNWEEDKLEGGLTKEMIQPSDLVLIIGAQDKTLMRFIPRFTPDSAQAVQIIGTLNAYYTESQKLGFGLMFRMRDEVLAALRDSEAKFRTVAQSAFNAIVIFDLEGKINFWNQGAARIFGYGEQEALGMSFFTLFPETEQKEYMKEFTHQQASGFTQAIGHTYELPALTKDGKELTALLSFSVFKAQEQTLCSAIIHDITESRQTTAKLMQSNAELEQFAYVASHDLKEPLRMITSYVQLLQMRIADKLDDETREYIGYVVDGAARMRTLITDLLEYSRIDRKGRPFEEVNLEEVLEVVKINLKELIAEKEGMINTEPLPKIQADRGQMVQLFQNLIGNALKFNEGQPIVQIGAVPEGIYYRFSVKDNGIGIDPKSAGRIFGMFQRLHTREEYPGTGIGLAICKKIVERHGGKIWFQSEVGKGTTFYFLLKK